MPARTAGRGGREYDAFLSYSRRLDGQIATSLERELQRFAKPWYRARALRVFRDASSLSANPALWPSIEQALAHTKYFVLLASPASATSPWVGHEVQWWLANRPLDRLLIALTAGQLPWDATGPVPPQERAIAGYVAARYGREAPRWVDLRALHHESQVSRHNPVVQDAVADIGATIRGVPKDLLVGEHIREHRRTLRIAATGLVLLVILAVLSTVASVVVFRQRNAARLQARLATARQLAATAEASVGSDLSQAMLLAAAAYRMSPSPQTLQAVYAAATASPKLTRFLYAPATITALAATPDGRTILSADTSGAITRFDRVTGASTRIGTVPHVDALAASTDAATVAVTDGRRVELLGKSPRNLPLSGGRSVRSLAVSPDGRTVVVGGQIDANQKGFIDIVDTTSLHAHDLTGSAGVALVAATDTRVSVVTFGGWATIDLSGQVLDGGNRTGIEGAHVYAAAIAPDGSRFSYTNSAPEIPVWPLSGDPDIGHPPVAGRGPGHAPTAMALAPGGQRMAVADSGTIYVSTVGSPKSAAGDYTAQLTGVGDRPTSFVTFAGDASHVVSSAGNQLALWNLDQAATIAESQSTTLVPSCLACPGTIIRVSPDGHQVAYTESFEGKLVVHDLTQDREIAAARDASPAAPSWSVDGHELYLPLQQQDALVVIDASTGNEIRRIPVHRADTYVGAQTLSATSVAVFDESGGVSLVDLRTNSTRYVPWPSHRQGPGVASAEEVSISPDATTVYYATAAGLSAMNLRTGRLDVLSRATDFAAVAAEGTSLLVTRYHSVEVRALSGALQRRVAGAGVLAAASGGGGLFAYQTDDGTVHILETGGLPLGTFALPGSAEARKTTLAFTADGSRLFALTEGLESGGRLESWQLSPSVMISMLCRAAGRRLTASAWRAAAPGQPFVSGCD